MPQQKKELTDEERAQMAKMQRSSWQDDGVDYREADLDRVVARYTPDAISIPANHHTLWSPDAIRSWYARRTQGDYDMNVVAQTDVFDIVGDVAVALGIFRVTRSPAEGVAGLDHAGRYMTISRRIDGEWKLWREVDTPSPDADVLYDKIARGW